MNWGKKIIGLKEIMYETCYTIPYYPYPKYNQWILFLYILAGVDLWEPVRKFDCQMMLQWDTLLVRFFFLFLQRL